MDLFQDLMEDHLGIQKLAIHSPDFFLSLFITRSSFFDLVAQVILIHHNISLNFRFGILLLLEILEFLLEFTKKVSLMDFLFSQLPYVIIEFLSFLNTQHEKLEIFLFVEVDILLLTNNGFSFLMFLKELFLESKQLFAFWSLENILDFLFASQNLCFLLFFLLHI